VNSLNISIFICCCSFTDHSSIVIFLIRCKYRNMVIINIFFAEEKLNIFLEV
jgi:hypothetical protein